MLHMARVVKWNSASNSVDIVIMQDNRRFSGVQVLAKHAGGDFGSYGLGVPTQEGYEASTTRKRDIFAAVGFIGPQPIILGFLFPQVTQMLFHKDTEPRWEEMSIDRHPSDVYTLIDGDGNMEIHHPSGAFVRIAEDPAFEDLKERDYLERWKIEQNRDKRVHIHVEQAGQVAWIDIDPDGNTVIVAPVVKVDSPKTIITGDVTIGGSLNVAGDIGSQSDVIAGDGDVSLLQHKHTGVDPGPGMTGTATIGAGMPPADTFTPDEHLPAANPDF